MEKIKESVLKDSKHMISTEIENNNKVMDRIMLSVREKFDTLKQELFSDIENKMKALKADLKKELATQQKSKKTVVVSYLL